MAKILLVNPKRKRKKTKRKKRARRNPILANPANPRKRKRRAKRNPSLLKRGGPGKILFATLGGVLEKVGEVGLRIFKKQDGTPMIPKPLRVLAGPAVGVLFGPAVLKDKGEDLALGAVGAAGAEITETIVEKVLPDDIKQKLGLSGLGSLVLVKEEAQTPDIGQISDEEWQFVKEAIPFLIRYKRNQLTGGNSERIPLNVFSKLSRIA
jgi:hypothetical protein